MVNSMVNDVNVKAGLDATENELDFEDIIGVYDMCRFHLAIHTDEPSPWCALFNKTQLKVMILGDHNEKRVS